MRIPQIFIPDKDLNEKIEMLRNPEYKTLREITLEELMQNDMNILLGNPKAYKRACQRNKILEDAFYKIVNDTFEGKVDWENDYYTPAEYKAKAIVLDYKGKGIIIPVFFQAVRINSDYRLKEGFLHLGNENGPCKNSADKRIKELAKKYFKIRNMGPSYTV
ncbi:hypothetical protein FJZ53_05055 [Candidatus Woesearchaeota archaeon]|nr:hypothetical protein [Candidatus Woesearchaeota archaeon]